MNEKNYYNSEKPEFFAQFDEFNKRIGGLISVKYGQKFKEAAMKEINQEYETIYE